jgi:hypothetical protein
MNVATFIKWLERQPQHLEVSVIENSTQTEDGAFGSEEISVTEAVCFDDPHMQSTQTKFSLILGVA